MEFLNSLKEIPEIIWEFVLAHPFVSGYIIFSAFCGIYFIESLYSKTKKLREYNTLEKHKEFRDKYYPCLTETKKWNRFVFYLGSLFLVTKIIIYITGAYAYVLLTKYSNYINLN